MLRRTWLGRHGSTGEPPRSQANYVLTAATCTCGWTTSPRCTEASPICCLSSPSFLRWRVSALSPLLFKCLLALCVFSGLPLCARGVRMLSLVLLVWISPMDQRSDYAVRYVASMPSPQECSEETDFGQSRFGHPDLTNFGQSILGHRGFGQSKFWPKPILANPIFWPIFLVSWWGPKGWGAKPRKSGAPKGGAPKGGAHERWRGANISRFFFLFPPQNSFFSSLSGGLLVEFWWCFEAPVHSNVHIWSSRVVVCEPRRPRLVGPPGFHTTTQEPKRAHLRVPVFKNTKIHRKGPTREGEKNKNCGGREKKSEILGCPAEGCPAEGCPADGP